MLTSVTAVCDCERVLARWMAGEDSPSEALGEARELWQAHAVARDDAYVMRFQALARKLNELLDLRARLVESA
jgi:hypothetical protein